MRYWAGLILGLCLSGAAAAQTTAPAPDNRKTTQLSKLYFDTQSAQTKGKMRTGLWCISHGAWKWSNPGRVLVHNDQFDFRFTQEMAQAGYRAVSHVQDMFDNSADGDTGANYLIGATMVPDTDDLCFSVDGVKGTVILNIEFKIYDTAAKAVVDTVPITGQARYEKFSTKGQGGAEFAHHPVVLHDRTRSRGPRVDSSE